MQTENAIENGGKRKRYCNCCDKTEIKNCVNCQATCDRNWEQAQMQLQSEYSRGGGRESRRAVKTKKKFQQSVDVLEAHQS